jgi:glycosyltransferase involved in cell wall biosynthesis
VNEKILKISILTATYNAAPHLPRLIESLRAQTDQNFEWIVMDGGSQDETVAQLRDASDIVSHWLSEPDFGIYHALNKAIGVATGSYYLVMGADDSLHPTAIANFRKAALNSNADIISAPVVVDGVEIAPPQRLTWWRSSPLFVSAHSVGSLIKTKLHQELGLYSRRFPIAADTYFFLQVWKAGKSVHHFQEPVGTFGSTGVSGTDTLGGLCESFRANAEVRGFLVVHLLLLALRVMKNSIRINEDLSRRRK